MRPKVETLVRSRAWRIGLAAALIGIVALVDWRVELDVEFGFLYVFPLILLGTALPRWQIVAVAVLCTTLADLFDPYPFALAFSMPRDILVFISLTGTGLFAHAVTRSRRLAMDAEEQLEFLVNTSPAAILTMTDECRILLANAAAHRLFNAPAGSLPGKTIQQYLPPLAHIRARADGARPIQSALQCRGLRESGETFLADVFFSTYQTAPGPRVAAVVIDVSEALRAREIAGLEQLLTGSRILVGAMFHEVRNVCGAMAINYETLARSGQVSANKHLEAIGALIDTLTRMAATELKQTARDSEATAVDLTDLITDLRLVLDPYCEEAGITVHWNIPAELPVVIADRHRLLQVLLNLVRNSERAMAEQADQRLEIAASTTGTVVQVCVTDSGPGLDPSTPLFEPFQRDASATGLGLYLSRALLRSFQGDLRHDPTVPGCSFVIELKVVQASEETTFETDPHGTLPLAVG